MGADGLAGLAEMCSICAHTIAQDKASSLASRCPISSTASSDRVLIANDFIKRFHYPIPLGVDTMADKVEHVYAGWPERFYIVNPNGVIVYKGEPGPFGFHPEEVEAWLAKNFAS